MKKAIFKSLLMAGFVGFVFTSCKKDNNNNNNNPSNPNDPSNVATANLVAYFPFDGNGNEKISGMTPTTTTPAVKFVAGQKGQAYQGDSLAYMLYSLPGNSKLMNMHGFTVSLWLKAPQIPSTVGPVPAFFQINGTNDPVWGSLILTQDRNDFDSLNLKMYMYDDNAPSWKGQFVGPISNPSLPASTWMYLTLSYDSATSKFNVYVKGQKQNFPASLTNRTGDDPNAGGLPLGSLAFKGATQAIIGAWWAAAVNHDVADTWMGYFKGQMDELRIYNRALTDAEVTTLYNEEVATLNP